MPELVHTFQRGRMNKDLDERLVPNGEYRDALNLDIANSENGNVGALQNVKGNIQLRDKVGIDTTWTSNYIDSLTNPTCIGTYRNDKTECIYWFIASDEASCVAEFNQTTGVISPVLVELKSVRDKLKFSSSYLITGINVVDDFLFWTDDQTEPKKINIEKFKIGSTDFATHTKIPDWDPISETYTTNLTGRPNFTEADTTVIKKSPLSSPTINAKVSKFGNNVRGTGLSPVEFTYSTPGMENFTYQPDTEFPEDIVSLPTYGEWRSATNNGADTSVYDNSSLNSNFINYGRVNITFAGTSIFDNGIWKKGDILKLEGEYTNQYGADYKYEAEFEVYSIGTSTGEVIMQARINSISSNILRFTNPDGTNSPVTWNATLKEGRVLFEYKFPRFAYRWKYIDNEYSCFSPFSEVAFLGGEFDYVSSDGYNKGMVNNIRLLDIESLDWDYHEIAEIDILYKESNSNVIYVIETLKKSDYVNQSIPTKINIETEKLGPTVEAIQLLRPWDNVPRKAKSQEFVGNRIIYANYLQNYNVTGVINTDGSVSNSVDLLLSVKATGFSSNYYNQSIGGLYKPGLPVKSIKSIRTYQAGVVFKDEYGRETPVFTSETSSVDLPISSSKRANTLQITPLNTPPDWATHYKFFIKEVSNEYYNLPLDRFYPAEDGNVWLSFPSSERNKVDEQTYLILKKQHDSKLPINEENRFKILSISNEAPSFVRTLDEFVVGSAVDLTNEIEPGRSVFSFTLPTASESFSSNFGARNKLRINYDGKTSNYYSIRSSVVTGSGGIINQYSVTLSQPFGPDVPVADIGEEVQIFLYKEETVNKPEFEGRFFVKINRNFFFDQNVVEPFSDREIAYAVIEEQDTFSAVRKADDSTSVWEVGKTEGENSGPYYVDLGSTESKNWFEDADTAGFKLAGWDNPPNNNDGTGPYPVFYGDSENRIPGYSPPTFNENVFGIQLSGVGKNEFINKFFGTSHDLDPASFKTPDGLLKAGVYIRFSNNDPDATPANKLSKVYKVRKAWGRTSKRGARTGGGDLSDAPFSLRYSITVEIDKPIEESWFPKRNEWTVLNRVNPSIQIVEEVISDDNKLLSSINPAIFETEPKEGADLNLYYEASNAIPIANYNDENQELNWFNCYTYGNGVESNRIRDDFNAVTIDKGPKVSTVLDEPYAAERRASGFIFSQIYNSTSGVNKLNQFIQAEPITKDVNPTYGSIQKLFARNTDVITLCEDKCFKVLANKDALFNANGNVNLTSNNAVLGQTVPFAGNYGISKNPESFAEFGFRMYFTDRNRGAVIRLSMDGITVISEKGMDDFFSDNLKTSSVHLGSYDEDKGLYNLTLNNLTPYWQKELSPDQKYNLEANCDSTGSTTDLVTETTVSFKESTDGWTSRKSFIPESGISLNNEYYTFKNGTLWHHNVTDVYNNFYDQQYNSSFNLFVNEAPDTVKGYSTLNYTGTSSREIEYLYNSNWYSIAEINSNKYTPTASRIKKDGWRVNYIRTDLESGIIKEFENKEGKYFNYIKAMHVCKTGEGIGAPDTVVSTPQDYYLTTTISTSCSSTGINLDLDGELAVYYSFAGDSVSSIILFSNYTYTSGTTFQNAINNNFLTYPSFIQGTSAKSYFYNKSDGIQYGTQLYDSYTKQPLNEQVYIITYKENNSFVSKFKPEFNPNELDPRTDIPDYWYFIRTNGSGVIIEVVQWIWIGA